MNIQSNPDLGRKLESKVVRLSSRPSRPGPFFCDLPIIYTSGSDLSPGGASMTR